MPRTNPFAKGKTLPKTDIPKGKKSGDIFTKGSKRYIVISYTSSTGKRVRFARPWKGKPYKTPTKKNPYAKSGPTRRSSKRVGTRIKVNGRTLIVQRTTGGTKVARAHTGLRKGVAIPKGKRAGDTFRKGSVNYRVVSYLSPGGKRVRYARKV